MNSPQSQSLPSPNEAPEPNPVDTTSPSNLNTKIAVNIKLLERDYRLAVAEDEKQLLIDAANKLDARMREIREQGKIHAADRIAIMAALEASLENVKFSHTIQHLQASADSHASGSSDDNPAASSELLLRMEALSARIQQELG